MRTTLLLRPRAPGALWPAMVWGTAPGAPQTAPECDSESFTY